MTTPAREDVVPVPRAAQAAFDALDRAMASAEAIAASARPWKVEAKDIIRLSANHIRASFHTDLWTELRSLAAAPAQPAPEVVGLQEVIERDRSIVADAVTSIERTLNGYSWLKDNRGPYAWDDERYRQEFTDVGAAIEASLRPLKKLAADWSDCPTEPERIKRARTASPSAPPAPDAGNVVEAARRYLDDPARDTLRALGSALWKYDHTPQPGAQGGREHG